MPPTEMLNRNAPHTPPGTSPPDGPPALNRAQADDESRPTPQNNDARVIRNPSTGAWMEVSGPTTLEF